MRSKIFHKSCRVFVVTAATTHIRICAQIHILILLLVLSIHISRRNDTIYHKQHLTDAYTYTYAGIFVKCREHTKNPEKSGAITDPVKYGTPFADDVSRPHWMTDGNGHNAVYTAR